MNDSRILKLTDTEIDDTVMGILITKENEHLSLTLRVHFMLEMEPIEPWYSILALQKAAQPAIRTKTFAVSVVEAASRFNEMVELLEVAGICLK